MKLGRNDLTIATRPTAERTECGLTGGAEPGEENSSPERSRGVTPPLRGALTSGRMEIRRRAIPIRQRVVEVAASLVAQVRRMCIAARENRARLCGVSEAHLKI